MNITSNETLITLDLHYITNASLIYLDAFKNNRQDLSNLMIWSFLKEKLISLNFLPKNYTSSLIQFNKLYLNEATSMSVRSQKCASITIGVMPFTVGQLYVRSNFKNESKNDVEQMVENIRDEFKTILGETDWMDDQSKKAAIEKVQFN